MTQEGPMPDFVEALELRLRDEAALPEPHAPRRRFWRPLSGPRRLAVAAVSCGAILATIFAVAASNDHGTSAAYGKPLILNTAPIEPSEVLERVQRGASVMLVLGDDAKLTAVRPVRAFGGTGFLLTGDKGWCLTAPDPAVGDPSTADPTRTGAVTCARLPDVYRYGIALGVGNNVVAAIPDGAKKPTITSPNGDVQTLEPSSQGIVVAANVAHHSRLALYASDGSTRVLALP